MTLKYTYKPPLTQFYKLLAIAFAPLHLLNLVSCVADSECSVLTGFYLWLVAECCRQDIDSDHRVVTTDRERKLHQTQGSPPVIIMGKMLNIRSKNQARMIITVSIFFLLCSFTVILNELFPNKKQLRQLRSSDEGLKIVYIFYFYSIDRDVLWFLSCEKCTYCLLLWTKQFDRQISQIEQC